MNPRPILTGEITRSIVAVLCSVLLIPGESLAYIPFGQPAQAQAPSSAEAASKIPADQLDSLVAPIALYPDPLLSQVLVASTYPLEIVQLQQWLEKNKNLKDKALADAVQQQSWDPSIQSMAAFPDVVKLLVENIQWTTDLGNAFLAQQSDVMDSVQRMRVKAKDTGNLKSTEQQKVETKVVESKQVIVIEPAQPDVVYVPTYDPVVVYGAPVYPYYPMVYPPGWYYGAGMALSFGMGMMLGAAWGGGWCCGAGWGGNNININNNNNFVRNSNRQGGNRASQLPARGGSSNWKHNPQHRGGTPYRDRGTADRFGGTARGDSLANRQASARQQVGRQGGNLPSTSGGGPGVSNRAGAGGLGGSRAGGGGMGGADRAGSRDLSRGGGGSRNAFGGGSQGFNGSSARANSSRGASSMGSRGGGGGFGGGGRGGGGRGGGGGRRR